MDIVFQSGEFYNDPGFWSTYGSAIATLIGVAISGWVAVFLFSKGIKEDRKLANEQRQNDYNHNRQLEKERRENDKQIEYDKNNQRIEKFGELFLTYLGNSLKNINDQLLSLLKYAENIIQSPLEERLPDRYNLKNLNRINQLDHQLMLDFYLSKGLANIDFIETLAEVDYLSEVFLTTFQDINNNQQTVIKLKNDLLKIRTSILKSASQYIDTVKLTNPDYNQDKLFIIIDNILGAFFQKNNDMSSPDMIKDNLIDPIKNELLKENYRFIPVCNELLSLAKHGSDIIFTITKIYEKLESDIMKLKPKIEESIEKLKSVKSRIKNTS